MTEAPGTTTIGPTVIIRGKLKSDDDLIVKGRIDAHVTSTKALYIENSGIVKANVQVGSIKVNGILIGDVTAESKTEIASDGRVVGDILSPDLVIHDGAAFRGKLDMQNFDAPRQEIPDDESMTEQIVSKASSLDAAAPSPDASLDALDASLGSPDATLDKLDKSDKSTDTSAVADEAAAALDSLLGDEFPTVEAATPSVSEDSGKKKKKKRRW